MPNGGIEHKKLEHVEKHWQPGVAGMRNVLGGGVEKEGQKWNPQILPQLGLLLCLSMGTKAFEKECVMSTLRFENLYFPFFVEPWSSPHVHICFL